MTLPDDLRPLSRPHPLKVLQSLSNANLGSIFLNGALRGTFNIHDIKDVFTPLSFPYSLSPLVDSIYKTKIMTFMRLAKVSCY